MKKNIEQAAIAFTAWRSTRRKYGRPPAQLIEQAVSLTDKHTKQEITQRLGVNSETLERWIRHHNPARPAFLDITPSVMNMRPAMPVEIGVELNDGARLKLSGASADIAALLIELRQGGCL